MGGKNLRLTLLMGFFALTIRHASAGLVISEFLASNGANIKDEDGAQSDWLEVHNTGNSPVDLGGLSLTDVQAVPNKWTFPSMALAANAYLVIFCSSKNRVDPLSTLHTNFSLSAGGEYLGLYDGATVLSEYSPQFPAQTQDRSYGIDSNGNLRYFSNPSPGSANGVGDDPVAAIALASVDRGFYSSPFSVQLSTKQAGGKIHYTLDGSEPTLSNGSVYSSPISVTTTAILRAATFANGLFPSPTSTWSYIFPEKVLGQPAYISGFPNGVSRSTGSQGNVPLDFAMDPQIVNDYSSEILGSMKAIPTMSMTANLDVLFGAYFGDTEVKVSIEILHGSNPGDNEQIYVGLESHSHDRLKRSLRLNFRSDYGAREWGTKLLKNGPVNRGSVAAKQRTLILRGGNNRCWARDWNPDATAYTEDEFYRATFTAMNGGRGSHGTFVHLYLNGVYWGVYNLVERPDNDWAAEYMNGDGDDWFYTNHGDAGSADSTRWDYLIGPLASKDMSNSQNYGELQKYLDVQNFADYILAAFYVGLTDWPQNNWYVVLRNDISPLGPTPAQFQAWDGEWSLDRRQGSGKGATVPSAFISCTNTGQPIVKLWCSLRKSNDFMKRFATRVALHVAPGGALSTDVALARWDDLNTFIESAIVGESARWGDSLKALGGKYAVTRTRNVDWRGEVAIIRSLLQGNTAQLIQALKNAGFITDLPEPPVSGPTFVITQMHYHPASPSPDEVAAGFLDADEFEFIVLKNVAQKSIDVADLIFDTGITMSNPSSRMVSPQEEVVFVTNLAAFSYRYPDATSKIAGVYVGKFKNSGEQIVVQYPAGNVIASFVYGDVDPWPVEADGFGPSLHVVNISGDLNDPSNWIAAPATPPGATPTAPVTAPTPVTVPTPVLAPVPPPVSPPITPPTPPVSTVITKFRLINADTDTEIQLLSSGDVVSPGSYNIDAVTTGSVGSVQFYYNGNFFRNENSAPYTLCGDSGLDFFSCGVLATAGPKTVTAMAYTGGSGSGGLIGNSTISFSVGSVPPPIPSPVAAPVTEAPVQQVEPTSSPVTSQGVDTIVRINCGGDAFMDQESNMWASDSGFIGGTAYSDTADEIKGTANDVLFQTERYGNFNYAFDVPSVGVYNVTLLFAELYWDSPNARVFQVSIEGQIPASLSSVDLIDLVGRKSAIQRSVLTTVTDGRLNIDFYSLADNAKISAILVEGPLEEGSFPTAAPAPAVTDETIVRINCGGTAFMDQESNMWASDSGFTGGKAYSDTTVAIEGTENDVLFQTERYGNFNYAFDVPIAGVYNVTFLFAELYWGSPNARVFSVSVEGQVPDSLNALDLVDLAGPDTAVQKSVLTNVIDGTLNLDFTTLVDNAKISGILVEGPVL